MVEELELARFLKNMGIIPENVLGADGTRKLMILDLFFPSTEDPYFPVASVDVLRPLMRHRYASDWFEVSVSHRHHGFVLIFLCSNFLCCSPIW